MTREEILSKAKECVCGQREQDYGTPESNFQLIADLWNAYLFPSLNENKNVISPTDVAMMMALLKIARIKNGGGTGDSFVDLAGYAACGGEINSCKQMNVRDYIRDLQETTDRSILDVPDPRNECDDAWKNETGLFSKAFNEDDINEQFCDNCRWKDEESDGKHCETCCHNDTRSKESHWEKIDE